MAVGSIIFSGDALAGGPTGGVVVGGSGSITQSGNQTVINQASNQLALNWNTFNLTANESVIFNQPSRFAVALNRILDQNPSQIFGRINSNGQIFLINTHGIIFGATAQLNVGGLMASTLDLTPTNFLAGNYTLNAVGGGAGIVNYGLLQAASGGSISLIGGSVVNNGVILANYGSINLDGADQAVLDFDGNGLINIQLTGELKQRLEADQAAVSNNGTLSATSGTVVLQASAAKNLFTDLVNNTGVINASGINTDGGVVRLIASGGNTVDSGTINVTGSHGGSVQLLSDQNVGVLGGSIDASGTYGGGSIRVGGGWQGGEGLQTAAATYVGPDAMLKADATQWGNGGSVVVWGNDVNNFYGNISARGGAISGNGGRVETSSHYGLDAQGQVDASAPHGYAGTWLLDPYDVTISNAADSNVNVSGSIYTASGNTSNIKASELSSALTGGTNVFVFTNNAANGAQNGDITLNSAITASGAGSLYLEAAGSIFLNNNITGASTANPLNVYLWANYGGAAAGTTYSSNATCASSTACAVVIGNTGNATINTRGGNVDIETTGAVQIGNLTHTGAINTGGGTLSIGNLVAAASIAEGSAGVLTVGGTSSFNAGANAITLTNASNAFTGAVSLTGGNVGLTNNRATVLGASTVTGTLAVNSTGALTETGALTVTGAATFTQNSTTAGTTQDINLGTQANDFKSGVSFAAGAGAAINNLSLENTDATPGTLTLPASVAGNLTLNYTNAALTIPVVGVGGALNVSAGGGITIDGNVSTGGGQTYNNAVTLGADATLASTGNGAIDFVSTVNGAYNLAVNTGGLTTFGGAVGGTTALASLTTDAAGSTMLDGNVSTTGAQTYNDAVTLGGDATLASSGGGAIDSGSTVDGAHNLIVNTSGVTTFGGAVGGTTKLTSLNIQNAAGSTTLGGNVSTTGAQTYGNALTLGGDATLASSGNGAIDFVSTVDGAHNLIVNTGGLTTFGGVVGGTAALASLTTDAAGTTRLDGNVSTTGTQTYNDAVTLGGNDTLTGTTVSLAGVTGGGNSLTVTGNAVLGGALSGVNALAISGTTAINTASVSTSGGQTYSGAVTLGADTTLTSTGSGAIDLASTVDGAHKLSISTGGAATLGGAVGGTTALTSLTTNSGTFSANALTINGPLSVTTTAGGITQGGAFTVAGTSSFNAGANAITLTNASNAFTGAVSLTGGNVGLTNNRATVLGASTVTGTLAVNSTGALTETGALTVTGAATFTQNSTTAGTTQDINLGTQANDFKSGVSFAAGAGAAINNLSLENTDATPGTLTLPASVAGNLTLNYTNAALTIPVVGVGGALNVSAGGGITIDGNVSTGGGQTYNNAVTLGADATLASTGNGAIDFVSTVNGAYNLAVNTGGLTTFGGAVGGTTALASLTTDAAGSTMLDGNVSTTGAQTYNDAVTLGGDATLASSGGGAIDSGSTVDGAHNLIVNTSGVTTFGGAVGGTTKLTSLNIQNAAGSTTLGGNVSPTGAQTYGNALTLGGDATLASSGNGAIDFVSTVDGAHNLIVNTGGLTTFGGVVGGTAALASLTTDAAGTTRLDGNVSTTGTQTYNDAVTLGGNDTLTGTTVSLAGVTGGGNSLTVTGNAVLGGALSGVNALAISGTTAINTASVSTSGGQTYSGAVTLGADTTLTSTGSGAIDLASTVDGAHKLSISTGGAATLGGAVGGTTALTSLTTNSGTFSANALTINGPLSVTTTAGGITQGGAFTVAGTSSFNAGANAITLTNASNAFTGAVSLTGGTTQITDAGALTLGTLSTGALTAISTGALNLGSGSIGGNLQAT
ncbi:filamentous hemagglutinin N-terminal domain-containing protein, partial [Rhodanobacter sp. B04]|uniref:two-partner secretion domain-containing protein n=1 Tax=Rhodanobacter sp. B04 TaxID=1945860 RepID=UPI00143C0D5D